MASPFTYFRKHTKVFMAVAAVLCMFIFVVGGALNPSGPSGGEGANATVATWKGGSLDQQQLNTLISHRIITNDFLTRLLATAGVKSDYDLPTDIPLQGILLTDQQRDNLEQIVVETEVEADLAKRAGITVSDDIINLYIEQLGLNKVGEDQMLRLLGSVGNGNPNTSEGIVFGTLRKLLLAFFYTQMYVDGGSVVLPHERWEDWRQVNERVALQVATLPVEKFLSEVPEPTEAQLLALYNDYKNAPPEQVVRVGDRLLKSPTPGFSEPRRVRLQYLKGSVSELAEKLKDKVTEEDIAYYYEQHKAAEFLKLGVPSSTESEATPESTPAAEPATTDSPAATPPAEAAASEPTAPPATEEPAAPSTPEAEASPAETPAETPAAPADGEQSSTGRSTSPFRLVSFQDAPATTAEPETPAAEPAADAATTEEAPAETAPAAEEKPAAETTPAAPEAPATKPAAEEYEPLENVKDEIRLLLAREMAVDQLEQVMGESMAQLQSEFNSFGSAVIEAEEAKKKAPKPPAKLADLQWLADKNGLAYEKTSPLTDLELFATPLGKAIGSTTQQMNVTQAVFTSLSLFEPFLAADLDGDAYIVLKTEDIASRVPEFKEVKEQVAKAWKQREAAKLAEKKAKELAAEIEKSNTPFDQFFFADRGYEVIKETALFSWLNYPTGRPGMGSLPILSDVPELESIGPEFMEAVFSLKDNKTVGLLNHDQTAAYVVRLARKQWTDDELKQLFLEEETSWPGRIDMIGKHRADFNRAIADDIFVQRAGLKFDDKWVEERQKRLEGKQ